MVGSPGPAPEGEGFPSFLGTFPFTDITFLKVRFPSSTHSSLLVRLADLLAASSTF